MDMDKKSLRIGGKGAGLVGGFLWLAPVVALTLGLMIGAMADGVALASRLVIGASMFCWGSAFSLFAYLRLTDRDTGDLLSTLVQLVISNLFLFFGYGAISVLADGRALPFGLSLDGLTALAVLPALLGVYFVGAKLLEKSNAAAVT